MTSKNSFGARDTLSVDGKQYTLYRLAALDQLSGGNAAKLPFSRDPTLDEVPYPVRMEPNLVVEFYSR